MNYEPSCKSGRKDGKLVTFKEFVIFFPIFKFQIYLNTQRNYFFNELIIPHRQYRLLLANNK